MRKGCGSREIEKTWAQTIRYKVRCRKEANCRDYWNGKVGCGKLKIGVAKYDWRRKEREGLNLGGMNRSPMRAFRVNECENCSWIPRVLPLVSPPLLIFLIFSSYCFPRRPSWWWSAISSFFPRSQTPWWRIFVCVRLKHLRIKI